jgi:hypothetical protein
MAWVNQLIAPLGDGLRDCHKTLWWRVNKETNPRHNIASVNCPENRGFTGEIQEILRTLSVSACPRLTGWVDAAQSGTDSRLLRHGL